MGMARQRPRGRLLAVVDLSGLKGEGYILWIEIDFSLTLSSRFRRSYARQTLRMTSKASCHPQAKSRTSKDRTADCWSCDAKAADP